MYKSESRKPKAERSPKAEPEDWRGVSLMLLPNDGKPGWVQLAAVLGGLHFSGFQYLKAKYENEHLPMNPKTSWSWLGSPPSPRPSPPGRGGNGSSVLAESGARSVQGFNAGIIRGILTPALPMNRKTIGVGRKATLTLPSPPGEGVTLPASFGVLPPAACGRRQGQCQDAHTCFGLRPSDFFRISGTRISDFEFRAGLDYLQPSQISGRRHFIA
jgi:hypothetical protein